MAGKMVNVNKLPAKFLEFNCAMSGRVEPFLPQARENTFLLYERKVGERVLAAEEQVIVDAVGGRTCPFAHFKKLGSRARIIAIDYSDEELR